MSVQEYKKIFCRNVHWRREKAELSTLELVQNSGIPLEMLEALELGEIPREMMVEDALDLARVFGCGLYELFKSMPPQNYGTYRM